MKESNIRNLAYHIDQIRTILYNMSTSEIDEFNKIVTITDLLNDDRLTETVIYLEMEFEKLYPNSSINIL